MTITDDTLDAANRRLVAQLADNGALDPAWADIFTRVPRHLFVPDRIWKNPAWIDRASNAYDWLAEVYGDEPVITQINDGDPGASGFGMPTSSTSMPTVVANMLTYLDLPDTSDGRGTGGTGADGTRVLEVGTGTGWNAALMSARVGEQNVTSVEIDWTVATRARAALNEAGWHPNVVIGDGTLGHTGGAPYDRVIATVAAQRVPYDWVDQTRTGGKILALVGNLFDSTTAFALDVHDDGTASGHAVDPKLGFMWLRDQRPPSLRTPAFRARHTRTTTGINPDALSWDNVNAKFAVGLHMPDVQTLWIDADDDPAWPGGVGGDGEDFEFWLLADGGSWAHVDVLDGATTHLVYQHGPRRLWDEAAAAYQWWLDEGSPQATRFGLTVTPVGQRFWLDHPSNTVPAEAEGHPCFSPA